MLPKWPGRQQRLPGARLAARLYFSPSYVTNGDPSVRAAPSPVTFISGWIHGHWLICGAPSNCTFIYFLAQTVPTVAPGSPFSWLLRSFNEHPVCCKHVRMFWFHKTFPAQLLFSPPQFWNQPLPRGPCYLRSWSHTHQEGWRTEANNHDLKPRAACASFALWNKPLGPEIKLHVCDVPRATPVLQEQTLKPTGLQQMPCIPLTSLMVL